jgi:hypothetical protein
VDCRATPSDRVTAIERTDHRRKVQNLQEAPRDPTTHTEALEILRGLVDRVVVTPAEHGFTIELVGAITHMIKLSAGSEYLTKEPYASSVKVVAGHALVETDTCFLSRSETASEQALQIRLMLFGQAETGHRERVRFPL